MKLLPSLTSFVVLQLQLLQWLVLGADSNQAQFTLLTQFKCDGVAVCATSQPNTTFNVVSKAQCVLYCQRQRQQPKFCVGVNYQGQSKNCDVYYYEVTKYNKNVNGCHYIRRGSVDNLNCQQIFPPVCNTLFVTADDYFLNVYVNGTQVAFDAALRTGWTKPSAISLPCGVILTVAVHAENLGWFSGVLVWDLSGIIRSDTQWKCESSPDSEWTSNSFNDSTWAAATDLGSYTTGVWGSAVSNSYGPNPTSAAHWIWFPVFLIGDAYCRVTLSYNMTN